MAEAIISRAASTTEPLPIAPGYHTVGVTVRDYTGNVVPNFRLQCTDGDAFYNYTTNSKGKCVFMVNSGSANIYANNYADNGYRYIDFNEPGWFNLDAPVGLTQTLNINLESGENVVELLQSTNFSLISEKKCDMYIVGGGGGGGQGDGKYGSGGGAGYMNNYYNQILNGGYQFIAGAGGGGGRNTINGETYESGNTGATSYINGTSYSAIGGEGGRASGGGYYNADAGGNGGLGNGAYGNGRNAGNSPVNFAGGGGGLRVRGSSTYVKAAGYPYGGKGQRGGGGDGINDIAWTGAGGGGQGMLRIEFK